MKQIAGRARPFTRTIERDGETRERGFLYEATAQLWVSNAIAWGWKEVTR
jgi:hypothetical protein